MKDDGGHVMRGRGNRACEVYMRVVLLLLLLLLMLMLLLLLLGMYDQWVCRREHWRYDCLPLQQLLHETVLRHKKVLMLLLLLLLLLLL